MLTADVMFSTIPTYKENENKLIEYSKVGRFLG